MKNGKTTSETLEPPVEQAESADSGALCARLRAAPQLVDPKAAAARVADWVKAAPRLAAVAPAKSRARALIAGIADGSPYLAALIERDPDRAAALLAAPPEASLAAALAAARAAGQAASEAEAMRVLRLAKRDVHLLTAMADLGGLWDVPQVTAALSDLADAAVEAALDHLIGSAAASGKITPADPAHPARSGLAMLAMGKHGARELNYSSDIDLIAFYDPEAAPLGGDVEPGPFFVRIVQGVVRMLQERTGDGYVFRTDLRLRPDPGSTAVAISRDAALQYYESVGQNWERAAMIKARPCAGDIAVGEAILADLAPFVWRRYLDYAAIADVHAMKRQINAHRGHGAIAVEGHNVKLGRGGIREIEFFVQTQQLVAGGRNRPLRVRGTEEALAELAAGGWIEEGVRAELVEAYRFLREVEHRLQMVDDAQIHTLPEDRAALGRFARFAGYEGRDAFAAALLTQLETVQGHYARLFEHAPPLAAAEGSLVFTGDDDDPETLATLKRMGFLEPTSAAALVRGWHHGRYPSMRSARAREILTELVPSLLDAFARTGRPDAALGGFDKALGRMSSAVPFLALLRENAGLLGLLADVLGTAPRLGDAIARRPQVLDTLLEPAFFAAIPDAAELSERLEGALADTRGYEDVLDRARGFGQEQAALIGIRVLSGMLGADQAGQAYGRLAEVLVERLFTAAARELARAHGRLPKCDFAVLAMGKLGGREMTASSDLDLILLYEHPDEVDASDGARPLAPSQYAARLTQRLVAALSAPTAAGTLYEVDLRLRPSGRAGPLATRLRAFEAYQANEAWTWEHMALTRARPIAGSARFRKRIEAVIREVLARPREAAKVLADIRDMRATLAAEKGDTNPWDLKVARGGLVDIEFVAQALQLVHGAAHPEIHDVTTAIVLDKARAAGVLAAADHEVLRPASDLLHNLTQILRLCIEPPFDPAAAGEGLRLLLARAGHMPDFPTLDAHLRDTQAEVRRVFERVVGK